MNGNHVSAQLPPVPRYIPAQPTKEPLDFADLPIIDLAQARTNPTAAAEQVRDAMTTQGFLYIVNHGLSTSEMERMFDIANVPFEQVPEEEKKKFDSKPHETGSFQGYKLRQYWHIQGGVRDQIESYNINRDVTRRTHPEVLQPLIPEIDAFAKHNHFDVANQILRLLATGLEIPEETFVDMHDLSKVSESFDFGSITLLYSQPVSALQILGSDGKWRWVKHVENAIIINGGDALEFLSGGFYKATIHRVVQPPPDQHNVTRLGVYYFNLLNDDVKLVPLASSPVLQRNGIKRRFEDEQAPTMKEWRLGRTSAYGSTKTKFKEGEAHGESKVQEEVIEGVVVKHYN
ncbi:hypothetical protein PM082_008974 [Marasmius tenuissimus]|nr:hypothetical protein PM082_008974 [Marasmius tenuissimus]